MTQYDDHVALSHDSNVIKLGGPTYGLDLTNVHITHFIGGGRLTAGVVHHEGDCRLLDVTRADRHWMTSAARTVIDVAMTRGLEVGIVVADDFLHRKLTSREELLIVYERIKDWPGALIVRLVIEGADPRSESVGETLSRRLIRKMGLPRPELQFKIFHPDGRLAGRTDFAWPEHRLLGEFDGLAKYLRHRREGESIEQCVMREKAREDLLRELTGWRLVRLVWADLDLPQHTARRIRAAMAPTAA